MKNLDLAPTIDGSLVSELKTLTECSYCGVHFYDEDNTELCDKCVPLHYINIAMGEIYDATVMLSEIRDAIPAAFAERKTDIDIMVRFINRKLGSE